MTRSNRILVSVVAAALILGGAVGATAILRPWSQDGSVATPLGAPFRLTSDEGKEVTDADLRGKPTVLFFGFTFCSEVCPTTLAELAALMEQLGPDADRMNVVFVSVDPERDRPEVLHDYLAAFDGRIRGLTGGPKEVGAVAKSFGIYFRKVPLKGGDYTMDHTASVLLLDASGGFIGTIAYEESQENALAKLRRLASLPAA